MFNNIFTNIVDKLSGLNPIKTFIKYALDKFLNQFLNDQITLEDFKNGCLNLTNIGFNVEKINQKHLISSPYILHSGSIGFLNIQLPSLTQISSKSIEIEVGEIQIELKPNKNFYQNFKERIKQLQENMGFQHEQFISQEQISENNPMDFFKETLKQILLNIKIKVRNIVVKLYMNEPAEGKSSKTQYYLMMRVPQVNVHKNQDLRGKVKDLEEIKLDIQMPQFSLHLLKEGTEYPQYSNEASKKQDFPFQYPTVYHPSTILLFGLTEFKDINIQKDKTVPRLTISIITDYKNKKRELKISAIASTIQAMIDPIQIKIISRFAFQIKQFKNIFDYVKNELQLNQSQMKDPSSSINMSFKKSKSKGKQSANTDIFSSMVMSIMDPSTNVNMQKSRISGMHKIVPDVVDTMRRQNQALDKSVNQFNNQCRLQLQKQNKLSQIAGEMSSELRVVNFQKRFEVQLQVNELYLYLLKFVPHQSYARKWMNLYKSNGVNQSIPMSYFVFSIKKLNLHISENGKNVQVSITKLRLQNAKLIQKSSSPSVKQQFFDLKNSMDFYANSFVESFKSLGRSTTVKKQLLQFSLGKQDHFCLQQILRISQKPGQNFYSKNIRKYNFLLKPQQTQQSQYILYKPGIKIVFNTMNKTPTLKIDIEQVATCLNAQIIKQLIDIYFPLFAFKKLSQFIQLGHQPQNFENQGKQVNPMSKKKRNLLQSQFEFNLEYSVVQQYIESRQKPLIKINIQEINIGFYQSKPECQFQDLVTKVKSKTQDGQMLSKACFCDLNTQQLYFECFGIQIDKKEENIKLGVRKLISGLVQIKNSKITNVKALFRIQSKQKRSLRLFLEKDDKNQSQKIQIFVPQVEVVIEQKTALRCIDVLKSQLTIAQELKSYFLYLKTQIQSITHQIFKIDKKNGKKKQNYSEKVILVYVQQVRVTFLQIVLYLEHIFVSKFQNQTMVKLSTVVLAMKQKIQVFLNQMKNQQFCLKQHVQKHSKYPYIRDSNIILQIYDSNFKIDPFQSKNRDTFFTDLSKNKSSLLFMINKSQNRASWSQIQKGKHNLPNKSAQFSFSKKPTKVAASNSNIAIEQEQQFRQIMLDISNPINILLFNACRLLHSKDRIINFVNQLKQQTSMIIQQSKTLAENKRKKSTDSEIQTFQQIEIKLSPGKVNVDIRPSFISKDGKTNKEVIFSSTRSYLTLDWQKAEIKIQKRTNFIDIQLVLGIKYFYLEHEDRQTTTNPILIHQKQLKPLGFIEIFQLDSLKLDVMKIQNKTKLSADIGLIKYTSSINTITSLQLHFQHFLQHDLKGNYGLTMKQEDDRFQVVYDVNSKDKKKNKSKSKGKQNNRSKSKGREKSKGKKKEQQEQLNSDSDSSIQELTNAYEKYTEKMKQKKQQQTKFKAKAFNTPKIQQGEQIQIFLQALSIKQCKIKVQSGSDFQFISCQSMHESKQNKRSRIDDFQILKYIELRIDFLVLSVKLNNLKDKDIQGLVKIQNFEVNYSNKKKTEGFFKRLVGNKKYTQQVLLPLIRSQGQIKILFQQSNTKSYVKFNKTPMEIGYTSQIMEFVDSVKFNQSVILDSGWKKSYEDEIVSNNQKAPQEKKEEKLIMIHIPENKITLKLVYKNMQLLSNQTLHISDFLIHEQASNNHKIKKLVTKWVKKLLLNNVGGLLGGSALRLLGKIIEQILELVKFILGAFLKSSDQ